MRMDKTASSVTTALIEYDSDRMLARFAVVQRARMVAW
jgi:hypothetical protein